MKADVCLFLEGTYPYVTGGVSTWAHELIQMQPHLSFQLICILPPDEKPKPLYQLPPNVVGIQNVFLQKLPNKHHEFDSSKFSPLFKDLEVPLLNLPLKACLQGFNQILDIIQPYKPALGGHLLLDSEDAWRMIQRMYLSTMGDSSFLNFFWSWRGLMGCFYSVILADLPSASVYHALSTGYAGLFLARAHLEKKRPCLLTEHGIYTNERRIEITSADWLNDQKAMNLNIEKNRFERDLKNFWIDTFEAYSKICYEASSQIITLYEGNKPLQIADGADPTKIRIIPNGIDIGRFADVTRDHAHPPTIALIGRIVPIKDVKTFIKSVALVKHHIPDLQALIMGPTEEDAIYYSECLELLNHYQLGGTITFTGKVKVEEYIGKVDLLVLTSISESQPLVILEAGSLGIPSVVTDVGACRELVDGRSDESPALGPGGIVCHLADSEGIANAIVKLLLDKGFYQQCGQAIKTRVLKDYTKEKLKNAYKDLYESLISSN